MKNKAIMFAVITLSLALNLIAQGRETTPNSETTKRIVFPHLALNICESRGRKYKVSVKSDSAEVEAAPYEDFNGTVLCFDWEELRSMEAFVRFKFKALQYLFDDSPARPLSFELETVWTALEIDDQSIFIPQSADNFAGVGNIFEHLGFSNREEFEAWFERKYFGSIAPDSIRVQRAFYTAALEPAERKRLKECCPEYIEQAQNFLSPGKVDLSTLKGLAVESYLAKTTIELRGVSREGEKFVYHIIDERKVEK